MRFQGTDSYVATDDLKLAVNAAITLQRPLLIKGEPGTGKTMLAEEVAQGLGLPLLGDPVYGEGKGAARTMLHAAGLVVQRVGKPPVVAAAPMPRDFAALGFGGG